MENFEELNRAVESVKRVDAHAHNIVALDSTLPFISCFSEFIGAKTASDSPDSVNFQVYCLSLSAISLLHNIFFHSHYYQVE
uniref:Amidohydrolase-related domain-containing protein n=1 Tax=Solanum lycopersicum TaxID=4081 RepID=A0A3Q7EE46_SOLLC